MFYSIKIKYLIYFMLFIDDYWDNYLNYDYNCMIFRFFIKKS